MILECLCVVISDQNCEILSPVRGCRLTPNYVKFSCRFTFLLDRSSTSVYNKWRRPVGIEEESLGDYNCFSLVLGLFSFYTPSVRRMATTRYDTEKFSGKNDFGLWRIKMRAILIQQGLGDAIKTSSA